MFAEGDVLADRYRILRELARGGMGVVYLAEHVETEEQVALKVMLETVATPDETERFRREAKIATKLADEHVVRVFDAGMDPKSKCYFLAMELLDGEDLETKVTREGPLAPGLVAKLALQLTQALAKAHGYVDRSGNPRPIVHRDLKPGNLFVCTKGDELVLKVLDFGISKMLAPGMSVSERGRGTPLYMAREQLANESITPATDTWAFGLVVFRLLTGAHFWAAAQSPEPSWIALCKEISSEGDPARASDRARSGGWSGALPDGFDAWLARCLAPKAADRHPSIVEAGTSLARLLDASALDAWEAPVPRPASSKTPEKLASTLALAPTIAAIDEEPRRPQRRTVVYAGVALVAGVALTIGVAHQLNASADTSATIIRTELSATATATATETASTPTAPLASAPTAMPSVALSPSAPIVPVALKTAVRPSAGPSVVPSQVAGVIASAAPSASAKRDPYEGR